MTLNRPQGRSGRMAASGQSRHFGHEFDERSRRRQHSAARAEVDVALTSATTTYHRMNGSRSMTQVQVGQKTYQMPPHDGFTVAHFITVADVERSARFYEKVSSLCSKSCPSRRLVEWKDA